jgi:hypothetical protein
MNENKFQRYVIERVREMFLGCVVIKNDPTYIQGIPDLTVLTHKGWFCLEVKKSKDAELRPNQYYYLEVLDDLSFARTVYPENLEEVLHELQRTFRA